MAHGALRAYGSVAFLKSHFGIGYRLTATKTKPASGATPATLTLTLTLTLPRRSP